MLKPPIGLNNPETYLISNNRFVDYLVLIFVKRKKLKYIAFPIELTNMTQLEY